MLPAKIIKILAKKYAVPAMEKECVRFLKQCLVPDNAFMMLSQAKLFDEPELVQKCHEVIDKNTLEALNGEGFTDIDLDTLCEVLTRDGLRIREIFLFQVSILCFSFFFTQKSRQPKPSLTSISFLVVKNLIKHHSKKRYLTFF